MKKTISLAIALFAVLLSYSSHAQSFELYGSMGSKNDGGENYSVRDITLQTGIIKSFWYFNGEINLRSYEVEEVRDGDISIALNVMGNLIPQSNERLRLYTGIGMGYGNVLENSYRTGDYAPTRGLFFHFKLQGHYQIHKNLYGSARVQFTSYRCATAGVGLSWLFPYKKKTK